MNLKKLQNESDIRGVATTGIAGQEITLTDDAVYSLTAAYVEWLKKHTGKNSLRIGVGRDSRISGPHILECIKKAAGFMGVSLFDTGLASTPAMFMSTITEGFVFDGAIMITASHLPFNRNGLKFFVKEGGLEAEDIEAVIQIAEDNAFSGNSGGTYQKIDFIYKNVFITGRNNDYWPLFIFYFKKILCLFSK